MTIRAYRPSDHQACRALWAEMAVANQESNGTDPGAGFEQYLARLDIGGLWVADTPGRGVVGMIGLVLAGATSGSALFSSAPAGTPATASSAMFSDIAASASAADRRAAVDPLVVTAALRRRGLGTALLGHVAEEARRRGLATLTATPPAGNVEAIRCLRNAGFSRLASVTLTNDLERARDRSDRIDTGEGVDLHGIHFSD